MRAYLDLFFMGAAFLLLETKNVVQFALLFGTTWFVNALVFAGILRRRSWPRSRWRDASGSATVACSYVPLFASLAWRGSCRPDRLLGLRFVPRFGAAVALAFAPVFLANLIFAERFRDVGSSTIAFGANLLGAIVGGVLEYGALVVGYRALLIVVAALYGLALVAADPTSPRPGRRRPSADGRERPAELARRAIHALLRQLRLGHVLERDRDERRLCRIGRVALRLHGGDVRAHGFGRPLERVHPVRHVGSDLARTPSPA